MGRHLSAFDSNMKHDTMDSNPSANQIRSNQHGLVYSYLNKLFENYKLSSLLLIFIGSFVVWSTILCSLLVAQSISLTSTWHANYKMFQAHEKTSNLIIELDDMMFFIVGIEIQSNTMSFLPADTHSMYSNNSSSLLLQKTKLEYSQDQSIISGPQLKLMILNDHYTRTNMLFSDIITHYQRWLPAHSDIISNLKQLQTKFSSIFTNHYARFQSENYGQYNPADIVTSFLEITGLIERDCLSLDAPVHNINARHHYPINSVGLALYMKWMSRRTAQYTLGVIYFNNCSINTSHFLELHYSSLDSLQSSLQLEPEVQLKYWEARRHLHPDTVANFNLFIDRIIKQQDCRKDDMLMRSFVNFIFLEYPISLSLRNYYIKSLRDDITYSYDSYKTKLIYHIGIAMIALFGIGVCLFSVFLKLFFSKESKHTKENLSRLSTEEASCHRHSIDRNDYIVNNHFESIHEARLSTRLQNLTYCPQDISTIGNHVRNCQDGYLI